MIQKWTITRVSFGELFGRVLVLLKKGAYKHVGSSGSIFIWNDCWLSGKDDTKIYSSRANNGKLFLVSDLIVNYR